MTVSEALDTFWKQMEEEGLELESLNVYDDEDLIMLALRFLSSNIEDLLAEEMDGG
jgi:hypothetical protein